MLVMERILCFGGTDGCEESPCRNLLPIFQKSFLEELVRREQLPKAFWAGSGCLIGGGDILDDFVLQPEIADKHSWRLDGSGTQANQRIMPFSRDL
jgi:hypothetical protein